MLMHFLTQATKSMERLLSQNKSYQKIPSNQLQNLYHEVSSGTLAIEGLGLFKITSGFLGSVSQRLLIQTWTPEFHEVSCLCSTVLLVLILIGYLDLLGGEPDNYICRHHSPIPDRSAKRHGGKWMVNSEEGYFGKIFRRSV